MTTPRLVLGQSRSVIKARLFRQRERVQRRPGAEPLEPRSLQSGLKGALAVAETWRPAAAVHVMPVNLVSALTVSYHNTPVGIASRAPAVGIVGVATSSGGTMSAADDTDNDDDQDGGTPPSGGDDGDDQDDDGGVDGNTPTGG